MHGSVEMTEYLQTGSKAKEASQDGVRLENQKC